MGRILIRGEYGHDIVDELKPLDAEVVIDKPGKGAFIKRIYISSYKIKVLKV